jgi:hypothetical protein
VEDFEYDPLEFEKPLDKLPESVGRYKIRDELPNGLLGIRTAPGYIHNGTTG